MGRWTKTNRRRRKRERTSRPPGKICLACAGEIGYVDYKDVALLRRFTSDRGKIRSSRVTGSCVRHQRQVAQAIKNAREMALVPHAAVGDQTGRRR